MSTQPRIAQPRIARPRIARLRPRIGARVWATALAALALSGCGGSSHGTSTATTNPVPNPVPQTIHLSSPAFAAGAAIPRAYTCDGTDTPPPIRWSGVPPHTRSLTLVIRDRDAPGGDFIHWSVTRIPANATHIGGGASLPPDAIAGPNSFGSAGYRGPCPPHGDKPHRYVVTLTAYSSRQERLAAGQLIGTYGR